MVLELKSYVIKTIYQTATKAFKNRPEDPDKPSILLLAPTGVATISIGGNTINSGLAISKHIFGEHVGPLSDERKSALRTKFKNLELLVIDEVSMVSSLMLKHIHERLIPHLEIVKWGFWHKLPLFYHFCGGPTQMMKISDFPIYSFTNDLLPSSLYDLVFMKGTNCMP